MRRKSFVLRGKSRQDISDTTVVIMLIFVIIISIVSLVLYFVAAKTLPSPALPAAESKPQTAGVVGIQILKDPHLINNSSQNPVETTGGKP